jgi:hypothetical protein
MAVPGNASAAAGDLLGFDTDEIVTAAAAAAFFTQGFRFCIRYVSRVTQQNANDLSVAEALDLLNAGLALIPVQHVRGAGWAPTAALGASDGVHAAYHTFVIGFPQVSMSGAIWKECNPRPPLSKSSTTATPGTTP